MKIFKRAIDISTIKQLVSGTHVGNGANSFSNVSELSEANKNSICFFENEKYFTDFKETLAGLIFVPEKSDFTPRDGQIFYKVDKPYVAFMTVVSWWVQQEASLQIMSISPLASVHPSVIISNNVHIAPFAVIEENVTIAENTQIGSHSVIMKETHIGQSCKIYPHVTIYEGCVIGNKVIIHSGSVIGADGFGYIEIKGTHVKIPQVGNVIIEDDVEIGANACIDRSTIGKTHIKTNTKIDNLVQIGHNCQIDEHSILCSQVGLAGNSHIGKNVYLAGQVGVAGHLVIEDNTMVGAQSGVPSSLTTGKYFGYPALPAFEQKKIMASLRDLPTVVRYVKRKIKEEAVPFTVPSE